MVKKIFYTLFIVSILPIFSKQYFGLGFSFAAGGRYDEVRMCVATPAGYKGGPAFEFFGFVMEGRFNDYFGFGVYIPVARPILFAAAFQMLQFLPEVVFSFYVPINKTFDFNIDLDLGVSLHYGPDYRSGINQGEPKYPPFFAAGPRIASLIGINYYIKENLMLKTGIRPYFEYLISENIQGKVIGAELDIQLKFLLGRK